MPGNGALVAAVAIASGVQPEVAGKPEPAMVRLVRDRFGDAGVMVGDRPSTDGALAAALDWPFALVRSGVTDEAIPDPPPAHVAASLADLVPRLLSG
jgi:ribonucleotide monophosphatase NagD (HAD superfamily)